MLQVFLFRLSDVSQHLALLFVSTEDFVLQTSSAMLLAQLWDTECFSSEADMIKQGIRIHTNDALHPTKTRMAVFFLVCC